MFKFSIDFNKLISKIKHVILDFDKFNLFDDFDGLTYSILDQSYRAFTKHLHIFEAHLLQDISIHHLIHKTHRPLKTIIDSDISFRTVSSPELDLVDFLHLILLKV